MGTLSPSATDPLCSPTRPADAAGAGRRWGGGWMPTVILPSTEPEALSSDAHLVQAASHPSFPSALPVSSLLPSSQMAGLELLQG